MTPEKILEMLPDVKKAHTYASENANEYICYEYGYVDARNDCANALAGKVVAKEDLLTVEEARNVMRSNCECYPADEYKMAEGVVDAQLRKANREN